jgi:hypothetical protein
MKYEGKARYELCSMKYEGKARNELKRMIYEGKTVNYFIVHSSYFIV